MAKKVIKITEGQFREVVKESVKKVLDENVAYKLNYEENTEPLVEMARINMKENGKQCIFPYNVWEVKIWSNDHEPPHFHIISKGWDVSFNIETGDLIKIHNQGKEKDVLDYMTSNVKKWLESPSAILPTITNKQNATLQWIQIHG